MGTLKVNDIASEMFKEIREDFPDMTFSQFKDLVRTPWNFLVDNMVSEEYTPIRMHYFGLFQITPAMARKGLKTAEISLTKGLINEQEYNGIVTKLNNALKYDQTKGDKS